MILNVQVHVYDPKLKKPREVDNYLPLPATHAVTQLCNKLNIDTLVKMDTIKHKLGASMRIFTIKKLVPTVGKSISHTSLDVYLKEEEYLKIRK